MERPKLDLTGNLLIAGIVVGVGVPLACAGGFLLAIPIHLWLQIPYSPAGGALSLVLFVLTMGSLLIALRRGLPFDTKGLNAESKSLNGALCYIGDALLSPPLTSNPRVEVRSLARTIDDFGTKIAMLGMDNHSVVARLLVIAERIKASSKSEAFITTWKEEGNLLNALKKSDETWFQGIGGASVINDLNTTVDQALIRASASHHA